MDEAGSQTGRFEIQAGGRRFRALQLLVAQKRLAPDAPIPCIIKTGGIAEDDSLAENADRESLHPLDQFRAFKLLLDRGLSEDEIAAAYAVTPAVVRQRLRLASASPVLLEAYAQDELRLESLMAFCLSEDHARQEQIWGLIQAGQISAQSYAIKRLLTEDKIEASDKRALFVGAEDYRAAGGTISRDLFDEEDEGYFDDPALLSALASQKLQAEASRLLADGWKWAESTLESPYAIRAQHRRLPAEQAPLTDPEQADYDALCARYDALIEEFDDESEDGERQRAELDELEARIAAIDERPPVFEAADKARAGVLLSITNSGRLCVDYGLLRPEDFAEDDGASGSSCGLSDDEDGLQGEDEADDEADGSAPHPGDEDESVSPKLLHDLTAFRTTALQARLAAEPDIALVAVLHALVLSVFYPGRGASCLQISASVFTSRSVPGLDDWAPSGDLQSLHDAFEASLPEHPSKLWAYLLGLPEGERSVLLAYCTARTLKAVRDPHAFGIQRALLHADDMASTLGLDMTEAGFQPTAENYFGRITKAQIIESVREARGSSTAALIDHLKKPDMAKEATRLVQGTGWLPSILRSPGSVDDGVDGTSPDASPEPSSLPAFLTEPADKAAAA
jgi:ParB family chromosome partitioning protein